MVSSKYFTILQLVLRSTPPKRSLTVYHRPLRSVLPSARSQAYDDAVHDGGLGHTASVGQSASTELGPSCLVLPVSATSLLDRKGNSNAVSSGCDILCCTAASENSKASTAPSKVAANSQSLLVPSVVPTLSQGLSIAASLSKARLSLLVVSTAVVGCALASSTALVSPLFTAHPCQTILCLAAGTGLTSAAANTFNQIVEIPYDSQMTRTRNRVLVRGLTNPGRAGLFAIGSASAGLLTLYLGVNPLVTGLAAGNMLLYAMLYTPLKQYSQANTWIGSLVGAVPPLMGWAAATGEIHSGSLILASLLYVWQFPHFMALSWNLREEYAQAGYMMTSVLEPDVCKQVALRYAVACTLVCLAGAGCTAISLGPWAGGALGLTCLPPNIGLIYYAWQFYRAPPGESSAAARRLFRSTLLHLPVVMIAALIGTYICGTSVAGTDS